MCTSTDSRLKNPKKTASGLLKSWKSSRSTSVNMMKRILRNHKLFGRIAAKKLMLCGRHIHNRIQWCKSYGQLHQSFWKDVIFSDEYTYSGNLLEKVRICPQNHQGVDMMRNISQKRSNTAVKA